MCHVSIVIPIYNEATLVSQLLHRVCEARLPHGFRRSLVIVDDCSTDATRAAIALFVDQHPEFQADIQVCRTRINLGKGAALRAGFEVARGDILLVQDGDLEYDTRDYLALIEPFRDPRVQVVFGTRFSRGIPRGMRPANALANLILTATTRLLYRQNITDQATGYKAFRRSVLHAIEQRGTMRCQGFEFCSELVARVSRHGFAITEVPISYDPRSINQGKKIRAKDGFQALWWLIKERFA